MRLGYSRPGRAEVVQEMLAQLCATGFDALQLKGYQLGKPEAFRAQFPEGSVMGVVAYGSDTDALRDTLLFVGTLGLPVVTWVPSWKRGEMTHREAMEVVTELGGFALSNGTRLSLHNHAGTLFENANDLAALRDFAEPGVVGLTFDTAHAALGGIGDLLAVLRDCREFIYVLHIKDLAGRQFCPLGQGLLDFKAIFQTIREISFDGWLIIDDESDAMAPAEAMAHAAQFLRRPGSAIAPALAERRRP